MKNEPLWTVASITAAATAVITLLTAFGLSLTADQTSAILGIVAVAAPVIVALIARRQVTANSHVVERAESSGRVIAGPANEVVPTGEVIRRLGVQPADSA